MFTYDESLSLPRDRVRLRIGDINPLNPLRQDETIAALVGAVGELGAIEVLATSLATEYAQRPDSISDNGQSISWSKRVTAWEGIAAQARKELAAQNAVPADALDSMLTGLRPVRSDMEHRAEYVRERGDFSWDAPR